MKAVLMSIQPKWCELIASGKKTVEVRKTKPKLDVPFKVYIYCTLQGSNDFFKELQERFGEYEALSKWNRENWGIRKGKVIGEFVCNKIEPDDLYSIKMYGDYWKNATCLSQKELIQYGDYKRLYFWHISNLVIYDKPKELSEFRTPEWFRDCEKQCNDMERMRCSVKDSRKADKICGWCRKGGKPITRPPQSWCYVEEGAQ